jgi:RNA polymerase sigma-70 factor (ECF subfamily)
MTLWAPFMSPPPKPASLPHAPVSAPAKVRGLHAGRSEAEIADGLKRGEAWAKAALFDRYASDVQRVLGWVLGVDSDLPDLLHDVFLRAFEGAGGVADPTRLRAWLVSTAVYAARERIRKRSRRFGLLLWRSPDSARASPLVGFTPAERELVTSTRALLDRLDPDERILITLRYMAGLGLEELADACGVSLATVKRRLAAARNRFEAMVRDDPVLVEWLEGEPHD